MKQFKHMNNVLTMALDLGAEVHKIQLLPT